MEAVYGYLVRHHDGLVLLDTGLGEGDAETEKGYRPQRISLPEALAAHGVGLDEIDLVVNCHLHFDHCGGNPLLAGRPVVCQRQELAASHDIASAWSADVLAASAAAFGHVQPLPQAPVWMERLLAFDARRVVFAHDAAVWEPA